MSWVFQPTSPMGGATGEAFSNVLHATGMATSAVLAREAIQNSVDAIDTDGADKVKVVFRRTSFTGTLKKQFVKELDLQGEFRGRKDLLGLQQGNCIERVDRVEAPLEVLYIEDHGTHGLFGDPHSSQSHFHRLLLSLGDGSKAREGGSTGGSYGYGKSVYSANSRVRTIVAYSVFDPRPDDKGHHARLMGCSYFKSHVIAGREFTGRAWFGDPKRSTEEKVFPFEDEAAHRVAEGLGFMRRERHQTGTSILIVDCPVGVEQLRHSIEEWWWPRIIEDGLDVQIREDDQVVSPPRPRSRPDLVPFIHCFEMAIGRSIPTGRHDRTNKFKSLNGVPLGNYGFTIVKREDDTDEDVQKKLNRVALIRTPRMVVAYMDVGTLALPCMGVCMAAEEVDHAL